MLPSNLRAKKYLKDLNFDRCKESDLLQKQDYASYSNAVAINTESNMEPASKKRKKQQCLITEISRYVCVL